MSELGPVLTPEIATALRNGEPVVALESSVLAQGLPYPRNMEAARAQEQAVRAAGALPATIAVVRGRLKIGLVEEEIHLVSQEASKAGARDLAPLMAMGRTGSTTVSATVAAAGLAGIPVVATGGVGGVHRDASETFDVSADLHELTRHPVAVVCSGMKNILDVPATMEFLETLGILVLGYRTGELPGFLARSLGIPLEHHSDDLGEIARILPIPWQALGRRSGVLITQPVPEGKGIDFTALQEATDKAIDQAGLAGIKGKELTPFLLKRIEKLTAGTSLKANLALLEHNAATAARLAVALAQP